MGLTDHDFSDPDISNRIRNTSTVYELDPEPTKKFGFPTLDTVHYKKCKKLLFHHYISSIKRSVIVVYNLPPKRCCVDRIKTAGRANQRLYKNIQIKIEEASVYTVIVEQHCCCTN